MYEIVISFHQPTLSYNMDKSNSHGRTLECKEQIPIHFLINLMKKNSAGLSYISEKCTIGPIASFRHLIDELLLLYFVYKIHSKRSFGMLNKPTIYMHVYIYNTYFRFHWDERVLNVSARPTDTYTVTMIIIITIYRSIWLVWTFSQSVEPLCTY